MKKLKISCIISTILLLLIAGPIATQGTLDGITVGDTIEYNIKKFEYPIDAFFVDPDSSFDPSDVILDLTGSSVYFKVMDTYSNGFYVMNAYAVLAKDIEIPVPDDEHSEEDDIWTDIFGEKVVIPKGVGIGIGSTIPGSDMLDYISDPDDGYYYGGLQLYHDPNEWEAYEDFYLNVMYEGSNYSDSWEDYSYSNTVYITVVKTSSEFILEVESEYVSEDTSTEYGRRSISKGIMTNVWFASGSNQGLFKRTAQTILSSTNYTGSYYTDMDDYKYELSLEIEYENRYSRPLPVEILNKNDLTLKLENVSADYTTSGVFNNTETKMVLDRIIGNISAAEGHNFLKYDVMAIKGCYYETEMHMYDPVTQTLVEQPGSIWWNGLTGSPTYEYSWSTQDPYDYWSPTFALFPFSPGITPDWEMWMATAASGEAIFQMLVNIFTSQSAKDAIGEYGVTINEFDLHSEMRKSGDLRYMYVYGAFSISFNSNNIDPDNKPVNWIPDQTLDLALSVKLYGAYREDGLLAGFGSDIAFNLDFTNLAMGEEWDGSQWVTRYENGGLSFNLDAKLTNTEIDEVPDAADADPWTAIKGAGGITPGFALLPSLLFLAAIGAILKRRKE